MRLSGLQPWSYYSRRSTLRPRLDCGPAPTRGLGVLQNLQQALSVQVEIDSDGHAHRPAPIGSVKEKMQSVDRYKGKTGAIDCERGRGRRYGLFDGATQGIRSCHIEFSDAHDLCAGAFQMLHRY